MTLSWGNLFKFVALTFIFGVLIRFFMPAISLWGPISLTDLLLFVVMIIVTPKFGRYLASKTYKTRAELIAYYTIFWIVVAAPVLRAILPSFGSLLIWALVFAAVLAVFGLILIFLLTASIRKHE